MILLKTLGCLAVFVAVAIAMLLMFVEGVG